MSAQPGEPTMEEVADLLRSVEFALTHGRSSLLAFVDRRQLKAIERDFERMGYVLKQVKAMLDRLPPEPPMSPEHAAKVGNVIAALLNKRFGEGTDDEVTDALEAAWPGYHGGAAR